VIDARTERLHVAGERRDAFGGCNAGGEFAQFVDRGLEIAQRFRVGRGVPEAVDLAREFKDAFIEAGKAFGRSQCADGVVEFIEAPFDPVQRLRIGDVAITALHLPASATAGLKALSARGSASFNARAISARSARSPATVLDVGAAASRSAP
jgi:hypothetical protein